MDRWINNRWRFWACLLCCSFVFVQTLMAASVPENAKRRRSVLVVNSYNESAPWSNLITLPIMQEISEMPEVDAYIVHLNSIFITNDSLYKKVEDGLFERYRGRMIPDCLVLVGNMAFNLRDRIRQEWGDIPMLLCAEMDYCVPRRFYYSASKEDFTPEEVVPLNQLHKQYNFTYIAAPSYVEETIDMMVKMLPEMHTLVFAGDKLFQNHIHERDIKNYLARKYPGIRYERIVAESTMGNKLRDYLEKNDSTEGMLFSTWFYKRNDLMGNPILVTGDYRLILSSGKPIFTLKASYIDEGGFLGGYFYDSDEVAGNLSRIIREILAGKQPRNIPFCYPKKAYPQIDYKVFKNNGFPRQVVPAGAVFVNKPLTFWERYKNYIIAVCALMVVLLVIYYLRRWYQRNEIRILKSYNTLIKNMPVLYAQEKVLFNKDGEPVDLEYIAGNALFMELFSSEIKAGIRTLSGMLPVQSENFMRFVKMVLEEKRSVSFAYYSERTGLFYEIIVRRASEKNAVDIFGLDTTALHTTQNLLRATNKKLAIALDVAHIIPWRWDLQKHIIACDAHHSLFDFDSDEYNKKGAQLIKEDDYFGKVHPDDIERVRKGYTDLIAGKIHFVREEYRICSGTGVREHVDWLEAHAVVEQRNEQGEAISLIGSLLVINDRKRNEQDLISAKNKAEESDRLKSAFLANMSHEIRTPLNAIVGFSSILASAEEDTERQEYISIIENNNQLLLQLISDILDLAKIEAGTLDFVYSNVDLNGLMTDIENTVRMRMGEEPRLVFVPGAASCLIHTERNRISQVLINLLNNAVKFTPSGEITFGYELRGEEIYFYVKDTGCGIPKEKQTAIFERFVKLNSFVQGTGLGLSICQSIVATMKGRMGVESEEGKGSLFWFTVPYNPVEMENPQEESVLPKEVSKEEITILIAEDDESNFRLFKSILQKDYHLVHAWDGAEAVELYKECKPHIILMDLNMPNMNGYEATSEIRKLSATVPIIAVTAYAYASDKQKVMESGFSGYMSKPLHAGKLKDEILSALNKNFILM